MEFQRLRNILRKCSKEDLEKGFGENVVHLAEYLKDEASKLDLVNVAISSYGKDVLQSPKLRLSLLLSSLDEKSINSLASSLGLKFKDTAEAAGKIASIKFGQNNATRIILERIGLDESYLPDNMVKQELTTIETLEVDSDFYEQLDYQFDIRRRVIKYFREMKSSRCIVHMPTGAGKTKTAMHIISELLHFDYKKRGFVLWMAHSEELLDQAVDSFKSVWRSIGHFDVPIIRLWGEHELSHTDLPDKALIFGGIQKLQSLFNRDQALIEYIRQGLNLIVVDECHKAPADKTREVIYHLLSKPNIFESIPNLLGLTATPGRKTGFDIEDDRLRKMFDDTKFSIDLELMNKYDPGYSSADSEIGLLQKRRILSTFKREPINIPQKTLNLDLSEINKIRAAARKDSEGGIDAELLKKISNNKIRNSMILDKLRTLAEKGHKTIFFACNVQHAKLINAALRLEGISSELILGESDIVLKKAAIRRFKNNESGLNFLINVGVLTTGFDSPNIDCVFISRPITSIILYSQIIGRGIRGPMMGGKEECLLIDVIDNVEFGDEAWAFNYFDSYWS